MHFILACAYRKFATRLNSCISINLTVGSIALTHTHTFGLKIERGDGENDETNKREKN